MEPPIWSGFPFFLVHLYNWCFVSSFLSNLSEPHPGIPSAQRRQKEHDTFKTGTKSNFKNNQVAVEIPNCCREKAHTIPILIFNVQIFLGGAESQATAASRSATGLSWAAAT
jgi:hypothetical protein